MPGKVYIVGAGPGDPDLLTVKAVRLLALADVVLHDELVNSAVLQYVRPGAILQNVGKRCGRKHYDQSAIHSGLISHARKGQCVVRLKGGDPSLFGRLGEELAALRAAHIPFEIVPGISAAFGCAAEAAIPLTDRHAASSVLFLSGHSCAANRNPDWEAAVRSGSTLVLYMPGDCSAAAQQLIGAGMRADMPCSVIMSASLPQRQVVCTTLAQIPEITAGEGPKLMIVGEVARAAASAAVLHEARSAA